MPFITEIFKEGFSFSLKIVHGHLNISKLMTDLKLKGYVHLNVLEVGKNIKRGGLSVTFHLKHLFCSEQL
jgi:hypothetical protein